MDTYRGKHKTVFVHIWRIQNPVNFMDDSIHTEVIALCHICLVDEDTALKKKKPNTKCPNNRNKTEECSFIIKHRFGLCLLAGFINIDINLLNQLRADLGDAGGQHESRQRCQVSWLAQVSSQESVTHDDVAAQDISVPLSLPSHLKDKNTNLLISDSS